MTTPLRWKLIGGFLVVLIAGGVGGAFLGAVVERHHRWEVTHRGPFEQRVRGRMQARLDLTPEQVQRAQPIIVKTARRLEEIRIESGQHVREVFDAADRELDSQLTPEQRETMKHLEAQRQAAAAAEIDGGKR